VLILTVDYTGTWIRILEISIIHLLDSHNHCVNYDPIPLYFLKALVSIPFESGSNKKSLLSPTQLQQNSSTLG
jgi:hypothetical protein